MRAEDGNHRESVLRRAALEHFGPEAFSRWIAYGAFGLFTALFFFLVIHSDESSYLSTVAAAVPLGVASFLVVALVMEAGRYEPVRLTGTLFFFGWIYALMFPSLLAFAALAAALLLASMISLGVTKYRGESFTRFRLHAFRYAVALLVVPVLWYCGNVDSCLDRGGAWAWSGLECKTE